MMLLSEKFARVSGEVEHRLRARCATNANDLAAEPGAYALLLQLNVSVPLTIRTFSCRTVPAGCYAYLGSARGPGGLRARIARHLRGDKKPHWHIDRLTAAATEIHVYPVPGGNECALVCTLMEAGCFRHPIPGFGSSDCRTCTSHLLTPT